MLREIVNGIVWRWTNDYLLNKLLHFASVMSLRGKTALPLTVLPLSLLVHCSSTLKFGWCKVRQYVNFNSVGKAIDKQLERLGATRVYARGEGDDDQNIEEDFEQWQENGLWPALLKALGRGDCQGKEDLR